MRFFRGWLVCFKSNRRKFNKSWPAKLTAMWLLLVVGSSAINWPAFGDMRPNEWGDFLAGSFSPLALFWLVAGYIQQGKELKLNTEALLLQQQEMKHQVEEFKKLAVHAGEQAQSSAEMVEISREERRQKEMESIAEIQPSFTFKLRSAPEKVDRDFSVFNTGHEVHNLRFECDAYTNLPPSTVNRFLSGTRIDIHLRDIKPGANPNDFIIVVHYTNIKGDAWIQSFRVALPNVYPKELRRADYVPGSPE